MRKRAPKPKLETPATVRADAEEIGRKAFEAATKEPETPAPPGAYLHGAHCKNLAVKSEPPWWESKTRKESE